MTAREPTREVAGEPLEIGRMVIALRLGVSDTRLGSLLYGDLGVSLDSWMVLSGELGVELRGVLDCGVVRVTFRPLSDELACSRRPAGDVEGSVVLDLNSDLALVAMTSA